MSAGNSLVFVDTNVLLYAVDLTDPRKQAIAADWLERLWEGGTGRLSWQVLNEFYWNGTRKLKLSTELVRSTFTVFHRWQPVGMNHALANRAWHWIDSAGLTYWDSLIVAAAEHAGCVQILSEDFQEGREFDSITVVNPFSRSSPPSRS